MDDITVLYGYHPINEMIIGMKVLESRETPGLGDKIEKDKPFLDSFIDLAVNPEILAATRGPRAQPNEVDAISGATISSKAVVKLLNLSVKPLQEPLKKAFCLR